MASLLLVRHGQASFLKENYDQLSEKGFLQGEALGNFLAKNNYTFDVAFSGTLQRHLQTHEAFLKTYSKKFPSLKSLDLFNEHQGTKIHHQYKEKLIEENPELKKLIAEKGLKDSQVRKELIKNFFKAVQIWAKDEVLIAGVETYAEFKARCQKGLELLQKTMQEKKNIIVFTSGGTIGMLLGLLFDLSPEKVVDLNWQVRNTSISEFRYSSDKLFLHSFNEIPHLNSELTTYV